MGLRKKVLFTRGQTFHETSQNGSTPGLLGPIVSVCYRIVKFSCLKSINKITIKVWASVLGCTFCSLEMGNPETLKLDFWKKYHRYALRSFTNRFSRCFSIRSYAWYVYKCSRSWGLRVGSEESQTGFRARKFTSECDLDVRLLGAQVWTALAIATILEVILSSKWNHR